MALRTAALLALFSLPCACDENAPSDPIGDVWARTGGGLCDGPCPSMVVYRDGDELQYHRHDGDGAVTYEAFGTLTAAGLEEFRAGSAEVAAALPQDFRVCAPLDGIDVTVMLDDGETQWEQTYCDMGEPEEPLQRVDTFVDGVRDALDGCTSNDHIDVSGC